MNPKLPFDKSMIVRTVLFALAWLNQGLVVNGYSPLPFDSAQSEMVVTSLITFAISMWTWHKNNAVTRKARQAEKLAVKEGLK